MPFKKRKINFLMWLNSMKYIFDRDFDAFVKSICFHLNVLRFTLGMSFVSLFKQLHYYARTHLKLIYFTIQTKSE